MKSIALILSLLASTALAQVGVCKTGTNCSIRRLTTTNALYPAGYQQCLRSPGSTFTWGWYQNSTTSLDLGYGTDCGLSANVFTVSSSAISGAVAFTGSFRAMSASAATPSYSFSSDSNTGLYNAGADQIGVSTAGTRSFNFNATPGYLEGSVAASKLKLDGTVGACLDYNATASVCAQSNLIQIATETAATAFSPLSTRIIQTDANTYRFYWQGLAASNQSPPFDLGGHPHPVMQQRTYALDMGYESSSTPTFYPVAPRLGGASATVTPVDAAAASTQVVGTTPNQYDARTSTTAAAAGSISSLVTTAFIRRASSSPRWCQKVSMSTTSDIRVWVGFANALPGANDSPANGGQSFRYSTTAGDSKWQACYANGVGSTCVDTGKAPSSGTSAYDTLCIDCRQGGVTRCTWWVNGTATNTITSGLGAGYPMFPYYSVEARAAAAVSLYAGPQSTEVY